MGERTNKRGKQNWSVLISQSLVLTCLLFTYAGAEIAEGRGNNSAGEPEHVSIQYEATNRDVYS
jgi:hypothetical protein